MNVLSRRTDWQPDFVWTLDDDRILLLITIGDVIDRAIADAFEQGAYTKALEMEAEANRQLFETEKAVRKKIAEWCDCQGKHIETCLTDLSALSTEALQKIVEKTQRKKNLGIRVNEHGILLPAKSLWEIFDIAPGRRKEIGGACDRCERMDCPYRDSE